MLYKSTWFENIREGKCAINTKLIHNRLVYKQCLSCHKHTHDIKSSVLIFRRTKLFVWLLSYLLITSIFTFVGCVKLSIDKCEKNVGDNKEKNHRKIIVFTGNKSLYRKDFCHSCARGKHIVSRMQCDGKFKCSIKYMIYC